MVAYKYCSGNENHIKSLKESYFWSAEISTLNDPCEALYDGDYYKEEFDLILSVFNVKNDNSLGESTKAFHNSLKSFYNSVSKSGIFSLSKTFKDELLWAH